jgi:hypothetical protein
MKTKLLTACLLLFLCFSSSNAQVDYLMALSNWEKTNSTTYEFDIFLKSRATDFQLTSYQCAFSFNQNLSNGGNLTFTYIDGSSQFSVIPPEVGIGVNSTDGLYELTFASMPGTENISSTDLKVGRFRLVNTVNYSNVDPSFHWDFSGTVATILTGVNYTNITVPANHVDGALTNIQVSTVWASATTDPETSPEGTIDGLGYNSGNNGARWAASPMPQWIIWDLGLTTNVSQTKISFYNFTSRVYVYTVQVSNDTTNWTTVVSNASSVNEEWTTNQFVPVQGRYVRLICHSNNENNWANVWEVEIWGSDQTTNVELSSLSANVSGNNVTLNWSTSSETNNQGFEIERKSDGVFQSIGFVNGFGSTTNNNLYSFTDHNLIAAQYVYRLKQIDFDGTYSYSNEVEVNLLPENFELFQNYPNPFNPTTKVKFSMPAAGRVILNIYDLLGQKVIEVMNEDLTPGTHEVEINANNLSSGVYLYQLNVGDSFSAIKKMMVMK